MNHENCYKLIDLSVYKENDNKWLKFYFFFKKEKVENPRESQQINEKDLIKNL